ncbi:hypothetical protein DB30_01930 [Enhygromyxa salina]|uniref:Uncharacterized protein n=1 Tax=Enhygromyxa salina TaxID=215803 RepID=A0A0C2A3T2_9BACT|nr:ferrochelatase [Enhygromyxa salina]KIG18043.1 hypothetical protein DB30_01930 [Enhygromyxa salina]
MRGMARLMALAAKRSAPDIDAQLRATTEALEGRVGPLRTLDPARELATPLRGVHRRALAELDGAVNSGELAQALAAPVAEGLCALALAQVEAFPGNLFWDLDLIAAAIVSQARALETAAAISHVQDQFQRMAALQHLYGRATAINFSYVHDFVYGFDWAKWVAREPSLHAEVPGPFSPRFLVYMHARGLELLELIREDDSKYPSLPDDQARNPFEFSREPPAEIALHRELARRDLIPVPTWDANGVRRDWSMRWREPFATRRVEVAHELGLLLSSGST